MIFPIEINYNINIFDKPNKKFILRSPLSFIIGPNGSGKTRTLNAIKSAMEQTEFMGKTALLSATRKQDHDIDFPSKISFGKDKRREDSTILSNYISIFIRRPDIQIKIHRIFRMLFNRDIIMEPLRSELILNFQRKDDSSERYRSRQEASGLLHLAGILSALYDDTIEVLFIDEPEISLHPQLQAFLLDEISAVAGNPEEGGDKKIIIIATHSTEMLRISKTDDLLSFVFCYDLNEKIIQIPPDSGELDGKVVQILINRFSQDYKLSLFSLRPLLVEGPIDAMLCNFISKKMGCFLDVTGSHILPILGKDQIIPTLKLMKLMGKKPIVLADADAFADNLDLANYFYDNYKLAAEKEHKDTLAHPKKFAKEVYDDFCKQVLENWVESSHTKDISTIAEKHPYWTNRKSNTIIFQHKKRACFCTLFELDDAELSILNNGGEWVEIKERLLIVLKYLEKVGCFILRKGEIERYYNNTEDLSNIGKTHSALKEIDYLETLENDEIEKIWDPIVKCINYSSNLKKKYTYADIIFKPLVRIASNAVMELEDGISTNGVEILAQECLYERASLFKFSVVNKKLIIDMEKSTLKIDGFPIEFRAGDNAEAIIRERLNIQ